MNEQPQGWVERVNEALLGPPTFYGAGPRWMAICAHCAGFLCAMVAATRGELVWMMVPVLASSLLHMLLAYLTHVEPFWWPKMREWLQAPQGRVDP